MWKQKIGLTMGKFLPFHQGHELLLQTAKKSVDILCVIIGYSDDDPFTYEQRANWVSAALEGKEDLIFFQKELDKDAKKDSSGTIVDEGYWKNWVEDTRRLLGPIHNKITHVFTSDLYGERVAKEFDATWFPVDPDRNIVDISGTRVRASSWDEFGKLPPYVRKDMTKVVALVGPESVGKSTLVPRLAEHYGCLYVPEYGRTVCHYRDRKIDDRDFEAIIDGQQAFINNAVHRSDNVPLVITDTEALVTSIYYKMYYPDKKNEYVEEYWKNQNIDLYIVMTPNTPWVQDGERVMTEIERWKFHTELVHSLINNKKNYNIVTASEYYMRSAQALNMINDLIPKSKTQASSLISGNYQKRPREINPNPSTNSCDC